MRQAIYRNAPYIRTDDNMYADALDDLQGQINSISQQTTASAEGSTPAPPQVSNVSVVASGGIYDATITDNNPVYRGVNYFLEYSLTPGFSQPHVIDLGASRTWRGFLGNQNLYWRGYSAYPTSPASPVTYFGTVANPTLVAGGGATAGPTPQPSTGSGTTPSNGRSGGQGFGNNPTRGGRDGRNPVA